MSGRELQLLPGQREQLGRCERLMMLHTRGEWRKSVRSEEQRAAAGEVRGVGRQRLHVRCCYHTVLGEVGPWVWWCGPHVRLRSLWRCGVCPTSRVRLPTAHSRPSSTATGSAAWPVIPLAACRCAAHHDICESVPWQRILAGAASCCHGANAGIGLLSYGVRWEATDTAENALAMTCVLLLVTCSCAW